MTDQFDALFDDRALRYSPRKLDPNRRITICTSRAALLTYPGQVQFMVAANLLARMHPNVNLQPVDGSAAIDPRLPFAGQDIYQHALNGMRDTRAHHKFTASRPNSGDLLFNLDPKSTGFVIHGNGWDASVGLGPSPLSTDNDANPFGPALATILAATQVYLGDGTQPFIALEANAFNWLLTRSPRGDVPRVPPGTNTWFVGLGSVGTATIYFLSMFTRRINATLVDNDTVKIENISRSPLFTAADAASRARKVAVAERFMKAAGFPAPKVYSAMLDELNEWTNREIGTPDLIVSAANERNVQYVTEAGRPPLQVYATTGLNWQVTLLRHIPVLEACSLCQFPMGEPMKPQSCATDEELASIGPVPGNPPVDPSLPFLSFLAGLMTAAEIGKLGLDGYPFTRNRVYFAVNPTVRPMFSNIRILDDCLCRRDTDKHHQAIEGSKFAGLSWIV